MSVEGKWKRETLARQHSPVSGDYRGASRVSKDIWLRLIAFGLYFSTQEWKTIAMRTFPDQNGLGLSC